MLISAPAAASRAATRSSVPSANPCVTACPAGIDVPRYIRHLRLGRFDAALDVIRDRPDRRVVFDLLVEKARAGVRHRENMRLARSRAFGMGWKQRSHPP